MPDLLILLGQPIGSPFGARLGTALKQAIEQEAEAERSTIQRSLIKARILSLPELAAQIETGQIQLDDHLICPLTLDLPNWLIFPAQEIYRRCREVEQLRQQVQGWGYPVGDGNLWLPIVHTARGTLYGEAIGRVEPNPNSESDYSQPVSLSDRQRQLLYPLGFRSLQALQASPAVYLMQFGWRDQRDQEVIFDRVLPFPAAPAIASWGTQNPDLLACHWRCLTGQPIRDLVILGNLTAQI